MVWLNGTSKKRQALDSEVPAAFRREGRETEEEAWLESYVDFGSG